MKIRHLLFLLFVASCAPTIKNFDKYQKQFASKSQFLPSEDDLSGKMPKIAVFDLDEAENDVAKQAGLGDSMSHDIENVLTKNRLAQLIDRKAADKLQKEIALIEMKKTGSYKGPQVADYAISGAISNAAFTKKYSSGSTFYDPKSKTFVTIPPSFSYKADVSGNIKIYELPSMTVVENIDFKGSKGRKENVQQNGGVSLGGLQIGGEQVKGSDRDDGLVRKAGADAIDNVVIDIKNALAQKGYILEKRSYKDKTIFKMNLGSNNGINQGDKFEVIGQYENENSITGKVEVERRIIATGVVADHIDPASSWIIIDEEKVNQIRIGDAVKMKYKKTWVDSALKTTQAMLDQ